MLLVPSLCDDPPKPDLGSPEEFLKELNEYRAKFAREHRIPNMYKLTWNESLVQVLKSLDLKKTYVGERDIYEYLSSSDSSWDGVGKHWRITDELMSFSAAIVAIDEAVHTKFVLNRHPERLTQTRGKQEEPITAKEMIHPLQTSIGCMEKERKESYAKFKLVACLLGNMGQWPSDWKLDVNSKIPGSECMNGYVNDDGLCVVPPPTTTPGPTTTTTPEATTTPKTTEKTTPKEAETVPATPMKPEASVEKKEKEGASSEENASLEPGQEALESSVTTRIYSYGPWIFMIICLLS
ncbi:hypothetical protein CAEBREN_25525 [Caenorhabditis brenneri]|uniref:Uncharacterized protein n=1 Tax=Caenorhabditis brenneri TaxID=135651 RepID=G0MVU6_CAEBE|nr:hypothetical protein CAEBREN_25525 [Caenorhabditis brenneri]